MKIFVEGGDTHTYTYNLDYTRGVYNSFPLVIREYRISVTVKMHGTDYVICRNS